MSTKEALPPARQFGSYWARLHQALMPDYNHKAALYWWVTVLLGCVVLVWVLYSLLALPVSELGQVALGVGIAILAGFFPVNIPRSKNSFAAGETFIFLLLLLYGPAAAALAAIGEGLIGACRTSKRWTSRIVSPATAGISMFIAGSLLHLGIGWARDGGLFSPGLLLVATMASAVLYFVLNAGLITAVPYLKRSHWPSLREAFGDFGWVGVTFVASASVACLLYLATEQAGISVLLAAVPIIGMLLITLHFYFREQQAAEALRQSLLDAAEHDASSRHMVQLQLSEARFHSAFTHASIGMALVEFNGCLLQVNNALRALLGERADWVVAGRMIGEFVYAADADTLRDQLAQLSSQHVAAFEVELRFCGRDGSAVRTLLHGSFFSELNSATPCLILQMQNVTARRDAEELLQKIAFHDSLTGLPNRRRFQEQLSQSLSRVKDDGSRHFGLLFIDFDRFKLINDSLGHAVGDEFLVAVTRLILQQVRPHDIVARLGGDEFAIIAFDLDSARYAVALADRLIKMLQQPVQIEGNEIATSMSIGITFSSMAYVDPSDMLRDADTAMYMAKNRGKGRYALFDSDQHIQVSNNLRLEGDMRRALDDGSFSVAYQPLYDLASGRLTGFEALARWFHPILGQINPSTFIPIAEDAGLIITITDFVLRAACQQLRVLQLRDARFAELIMHVNISGDDIAQPGLVKRVIEVLQQECLPARYLTLELTENILMERLEKALPTLTALRQLGISLSLDDFGTGYSSLQHLSTLPVTSLKIDRAFINGMHRGSVEAAIVGAVVALGKSLGKSVVAEGIESQDQMEQLYEMGCMTGQGFYCSRPLPPADLSDALLDRLAGQQPFCLHTPLLTARPPIHQPMLAFSTH